MKSIELISYCGLYCGSCSRYKKSKCNGCAANSKASWCKIRTCCINKQIASCAYCDEFENVKKCSKFNNPVSKIFEFIFQSERAKGIQMLQKQGPEAFVQFMSNKGWVSIKKRRKA